MNKINIIKEFEKSSGFRVCYWCSTKIKRGQRVLFTREYEPYRLKVIGASCINCFNKYNKKMKGDKK